MGFVLDVRESNLEDVVDVNNDIPEFKSDGDVIDTDYFRKRIGDKAHAILVAYVGTIPVGYMVSYEDENNSLYCWMAGVRPDFRKGGVLTELMKKQFQWARVYEYDKITIKTRNERREMLSYLMKNNFMITSVEEREDVLDNRILLESYL